MTLMMCPPMGCSCLAGMSTSLCRALDQPAEVQDGDAGQDDGRSGAGHAHELLDVAAGHGEPDGAHVAVPQPLVEGQLRGVEGAEDALVETADLGLAHRLGRVPVQPDVL